MSAIEETANEAPAVEAVPKKAMTLGLEQFRNPEESRLPRLLTQPLRQERMR